MPKRRKKKQKDETRVILGVCEVCGHSGGIVECVSLCGSCCFGEAAAQEELDEEVFGRIDKWK
jgi:ribosomal protein S14